MQWIHIRAVFECNNVELGEEIVSDMFFSLGFTGVVCQVPLKAPQEGFGSDALPIPKKTSVSGYIPDSDTSFEILNKIEIRSKELEEFNIKVLLETEIVDQKDWAECWKQFFHVTRITDKIIVKPTWREFKPEKNDIVIELDPGMAFGTGTHPTTAMCIALIEKYLLPNNRFLDIGTGSGILMVAAAKLGSSYLAGIDIDQIAVQVATENLLKNSIPPEIFDIKQITLAQYIQDQNSIQVKDDISQNCSHKEQFNLIAANIIAEVLIEILPDIKASLKNNGFAILSGIIKDREKLVIESLKRCSFEIAEVKTDGEWIAICCQPALSKVGET